MATPVHSNGFLEASLLSGVLAGKGVLAGLRLLLTDETPGPSSSSGTNPNSKDVWNQISLGALIKLDEFFKDCNSLSKEVYEKVHQTLWERQRQSPRTRSSTPMVYVPPV